MPGRVSEGHSLRGPTARGSLIDIRDVIDRAEPLADPTLDDFLDPQRLHVDLNDGIGPADSARIDVDWTVVGDYSIHYTDSVGTDFRWDSHPHDGDYVHVPGPAHFHPPPDASSDPADVEASCIEQTQEELVARAVLKLWRATYHRGSLSGVNAGSNPP